ncbi:hypothetical protein [Pedobacter ginsengisoli]|uniref:hypothetical protein n=1 Tax=Pedobacter ginsengisoli TaxID=363852 RepID=UPI00254A49F8|nr:hypothetical protein [Pedobacter ginsengisoli]
MKKFLKSILIFLLLLNGISAVMGGWSLVLHPDGSVLGLSASLLANSPFGDYRIPGIVLFCLIGILSLLTAAFIRIGHKKSSWLLLSEGMILISWLLVQLIFVPPVYFLHIPIALMASFFIYEGFYLIKIKS